MTCVERGVAVIHADLDLGLNSFADNSLDAVVCEQTLQTLSRPVDMLQEMLRVGRLAIASFPNFGYWRIRLDLALRGRMPSTKAFPTIGMTPPIFTSSPSPTSRTGCAATAIASMQHGYWLRVKSGHIKKVTTFWLKRPFLSWNQATAPHSSTTESEISLKGLHHER